MDFGRDVAPIGKSRAEIIDWLIRGYTYPEHLKNRSV